jgi:hypothetical protein
LSAFSPKDLLQCRAAIRGTWRRKAPDAVELYQLGCEYAQGFAFGEPMDADAAMRLLTEERLEAAS